MTPPQRNIQLGALPDAVLCERATDGDTAAFEVLARGSVAASVRDALGPQSTGAEVRVQLCAIVAGPELPRVVDAIQDS